MSYYKIDGQYICERELSSDSIISARKNGNGSLLVKEILFDMYGSEFFEDVVYFKSFIDARNHLIRSNQKTMVQLRKNNEYLSKHESWETFQKHLQNYNATL